MFPKTYMKKFAAAVVKRSGISKATVEAVLPHVFDEIRYQLTEGSYPCVPIESFGTFAVINRPEHEYLYNYHGANEVRTVPARRQLKFVPTRNMKREVEQGLFDPTRHSFSWHPDDPKIRKRNDMRYKKGKFYDREKGAYAKPLYKRKGERVEGSEEQVSVTDPDLL